MPTINDARVRPVNQRPMNTAGRYVLYWCQMARRLSHNHALDYALHIAKSMKKPIVVYEGLKLDYPWTCARFHQFMLEGMLDNLAAAKAVGINYWPFVETPGNTGRGLMRKLAANACLVVTDDYPAFIIPAQTRALAETADTPVHAIDNNGVIPLSLLGKPVAAAAHLRPRVHKLFAQCWPERSAAVPNVTANVAKSVDPLFELWQPPADLAAFVKLLPINQAVPPVAGTVGGTVAGRDVMSKFLAAKLPRYAVERNHPDDPERTAASGLSPYLHYGHVSMDEIVTAALPEDWSVADINTKTRNKVDFFCRDAAVNSFLDEAITWRDIGYHWHFSRIAELRLKTEDCRNKSWQDSGELPSFNFTTMDFTILDGGTLESVLPSWAWATLSKHAGDRREFLYSLEEFETATTHDELWNAAQLELVHSGRMHNYLRMLWAKKVLEWSPSPEKAYRVLEHLNNKYAIDGRDPNSYTGILWCFGLFDRPWPPEREVFGNIRFMSSGNTAKKFKLDKYYAYVRKLCNQARNTATDASDEYR